jgi:hypothetical protein
MIQKTTHTKKNMIMLTKIKGWCNPTRQVKSDKVFVDSSDSNIGNVIGERPVDGHS